MLALGAGAFAVPGGAIASRSVGRPAGFVFDNRFGAACRVAAGHAAWTHVIDGDVTALWYDRLDAARRLGARLRRGGGCLCGRRRA